MSPEIHSVVIPERPEAFKPATLQSHTLSYLKWGNAPDVVLCVHGLTRHARDFDFLAQALSEKYTVICPDMPGRGQSEWLREATDYNYATYLADIFYLLDSLNIKTAHWIGTSMGGIIAMMAAGLRPALIKSLVLNDVGCLIPAASLERILSYAGVKMQFANRQEAEQHLRVICKPFGITSEEHWQHLFTYTLRNLPDGTCSLHYDPNIITPLKTAEVKDVNLWPFWEAVKPIPTMLIRGAQSDLLLAETAQQMKSIHPNLTLHDIQNAGHAPALMSQGEISLIRSWLNRPIANSLNT
jgi:pimeloyl-ACP methyl ester carboxylesterase